jgi:hypothetical protein
MACDGPYWVALRYYHETGGHPDRALQVLGRELASLRGRGRLAEEAYCALERCRLLARMGRLGDADVESARAAIARLRKPAPYLANLERTLRGDLDQE